VAAAKAAGAATINYGVFLNQVIDFLIIALVLFLVVRTLNRLHRASVSTPTTKSCPFCISAVPVQATRCPQCTSDLRPEPSAMRSRSSPSPSAAMD
jgi:large conductance mechanosensitive channel